MKREQIVMRADAEKKEKAALVLQAVWRGFQARQHFTAKMEFVLKLQALTRGFLLRQRLRKMRTAARLLQEWWRNYIKMRQVRSDFLTKKVAAGAVQTWWRGVVESRRHKVLVKAAVTVQTYWRMLRERKNFLKRCTEGGSLLDLSVDSEVGREELRLNLSVDSEVGESQQKESEDLMIKERGSILVKEKEWGERIDKSAKRRRLEVKVLGRFGKYDGISQNPHLKDEVFEEEVNSVSCLQLGICTLCGLELTEETTLRQHMLRDHPRHEKQCIWPACKEKFGRQVDLKLHLASVHQEKELLQEERRHQVKCDEEEADLLEYEAKWSMEGKVCCQVPGCEDSFEDFEVMVKHFKAAHQLKSRRIHKYRLKRTQSLEIKRPEEEGKRVVNILQPSLSLTLNLGRKVKCDAAGCNRMFKKKVYMEAHMRLRHNKAKRLWRRCQAPWCDASFKVYKDQMAHFQEYHMVEMFVSMNSKRTRH